jgi:hypothetical protein
MTYRRYCFCDPAVPLVPYLGCAVFRASDWCRLRLSWRPHPLVELDLSSRVSPSHTYPTAAAVRSSHGLLLPTAHPGSEVHCPRAQSLPATFRLQGLATLLTACSLQDRVGLFSCRRRPWDFPLRSFHLPEGIPRVSAGMNPHAVRHDACSQCETPSRNAGPQLLGFDPPGNSWRSAWV